MSTLTVKDLIEQLKKPESKNVFVMGPYIGDYDLFTPEESSSYTLAALVKDSIAFYDLYFNKVLTAVNDFNETFQELGKMIPITSIYAQTMNGLVSASTEKAIHYIKGNGALFECNLCKASYKIDCVANGTHTCVCEKKIRPKALLGNEIYNLKNVLEYEEALQEANVIFLIGFDFNELELCKQLELLAAHKTSGKQTPLLVVVGECDQAAVFETFKPDFIVNEKVEKALQRLISYIKKES